MTWALALLGRVPAVAWALAALLAWGAWNGHRAKSARADAAQATAAAQTAAAERDGERDARREERRAAGASDTARDAFAKKAAAARADAAAARGELDRLRDDLAALQAGRAASAPGAAGRADAASVVGQVVGECAGALVEVAQAADACEGQLSGLQEWVRGVWSPPKGP